MSFVAPRLEEAAAEVQQLTEDARLLFVSLIRLSDRYWKPLSSQGAV